MQSFKKKLRNSEKKSKKNRHIIRLHLKSSKPNYYNILTTLICSQKKEELEEQISEIEKALNDIDYRAANEKAGYVYVISNIGAFGENIYKIGMTRRLDPQERVDELGDASVPFNFDVHAMIFSDNAPALEAALHRAFEDRKLNMVNHRREFFNVTLDEIKKVINDNYDKTVEFVDVPDAEQYRISQKMRADSNIEAPVVQRNITFTHTPVSPAPDASSLPNAPTAPVLDPSKKYLYSKWGIYEIPDPYKVVLKRGPRDDLKKA